MANDRFKIIERIEKRRAYSCRRNSHRKPGQC
jgi:hypothetical protein